MTPDHEYGCREFESLRARHSRSLLGTAVPIVTLRSIKLQIVSFGPATLSRIATGGSPVLRCNFWNMARKQFGGGVLWCSNVLSRRAICTIGDICDLPSSPEGAIKIDEICRDLRVAVGKIIFALQQLGLCRDDIQEVDRTLRVTLPGGLQSGLIFRDGPGNIGTPALRFAIGRQGVVDLLPGAQDRFLKEDGRFPLS